MYPEHDIISSRLVYRLHCLNLCKEELESALEDILTRIETKQKSGDKTTNSNKYVKVS